MIPNRALGCGSASVLLFLLLLHGVGAPAAAQSSHAPTSSAPDSLPPFVEQVRTATQRFQDHDEAVAAGYRLMGPDMPNMGEHWINPRLVMQRPFDPMRPSALSYVRRGTERILTGIAYIRPVRAGTDPPPLPVDANWHYHFSTLADEAFGPQHNHANPPTGMRLAMMHAWVWTTNPDGRYKADNWGLSYVRHGLPLPSTVTPAASKALFLATANGVEYFLSVVTKNATPTDEELRHTREALTQARQQVETALQTAADGTAPAPETLSHIWHAAWTDVKTHLRPSVWTQLPPARTIP